MTAIYATCPTCGRRHWFSVTKHFVHDHVCVGDGIPAIEQPCPYSHASLYTATGRGCATEVPIDDVVEGRIFYG